MEPVDKLLEEQRFDFVSGEKKAFIREFTRQIGIIGYDFGGSIGDGYCWGHYMVIYKKKKKVIARIFIRDTGTKMWGKTEHKWDNSIVLRLFFSNIDKHMEYIETAAAHNKEPFFNEQGLCNHCGEKCHNRKTYTVNGQQIEKCGYVFSFTNPKTENVGDYIGILKEFYAKKSASPAT
jgi:hypothetical protein